MNLFSLEGKVAVITGAAGFFGKAFSECLLSAGAMVVLYGRGKKIDELGECLQAKYPHFVEWRNVDLYDLKSYEESLREVAADSQIDVLVNNAYDFSKGTGFNDPCGKLENIGWMEWLKSFECGMYWHVLAIQIIAEGMKQRRAGSIINISSMYALVAPDPGLYEGTEIFNPPSYGAAKASLLALTRYAASFYGKYNIRCNALVPGAFPNIGADSYNSPKDEGFVKRLESRTALNRVGVVDDLKGPLIFLASDASSYVTGQNIVVDGGWTIR